MFLLTSLINIAVCIAVSIYSIMGYKYVVEGHGLHPLLCIAACLAACIVGHYVTTLLSVRATYAYRAKHYP
jgi:hypothetical protein